MKRLATMFGGFITVLTLATATFLILANSAKSTRRDDLRFEGVKAIRLDSGAGDITLRGTTASSVSGSRRVQRSFTSPSYRETLEADGTLVIRSRCNGFIVVNCGVTYDLFVPEGVSVQGVASGGDIALSNIMKDVDVRSSAGDVTARDMGGNLILQSSAGDVRVTGSSGTLQLVSSAGDVVVTGANASSVEATSSAGDVRLSFRNAPRSITASSSAGDVAVGVARSSTGYRVDASTSAGDTTVQIKSDPESPMRMKLRSSAGDVSVKYSNNLR